MNYEKMSDAEVNTLIMEAQKESYEREVKNREKQGLEFFRPHIEFMNGLSSGYAFKVIRHPLTLGGVELYELSVIAPGQKEPFTSTLTAADTTSLRRAATHLNRKVFDQLWEAPRKPLIAK